MVQPLVAPTLPPLLSVTLNQGGSVDIHCGIPKLEAVKMLLNVIEELRIQAYQEHGRLVQVPTATIDLCSEQRG